MRAAAVLGAWALSATAVAGQPATQVSGTPFTILPRIEGLGARAAARVVPVTVVTSPDESAEGVEVLRLVPSGQRWPAWRLDVKATVAPGESRAVLEGLPGERVLLVVAGGSPGYQIEGPLTWPARPDTRVVTSPSRRTLVGELPGDLANPRFTWVSGARLPEAGPWPACGLLAPSRWECIGVPLDEAGVLLLSTGPPVRFGIAPAPDKGPVSLQSASIRGADWCRLLRVASAAAPATSPVALEITPRRDRLDRPGRIGRVADDRVSVVRLAPDAFWVCGDTEPEGGVLHIEGAEVATRDVPFDGWHRGPLELPHEVMLDPPVRVTGRVEDATGNPAAGASVMVSRVRQPPPGGDPASAPPPDDLVQVTAGDDGAFEVPGLRAGAYEFRAMHASLGRATRTLTLDGREILLRLTPEKRVRGRVVRDGRPLPSVLVGMTPDLAAYAAGADPMELVTFSALTDAGGRFEVAVPTTGAGVLRVGDEATGIVRVVLGATDQLPTALELGDIELPPPVRLTVEVDGPAGCALSAVGPFGSSGMTIVKGQPAPDGTFRLLVPESGRWALTLTCDGREIPVTPPMVEVPRDQTDARVRVTARVGG